MAKVNKIEELLESIRRLELEIEELQDNRSSDYWRTTDPELGAKIDRREKILQAIMAWVESGE
jgi:hypothetical protein